MIQAHQIIESILSLNEAVSRPDVEKFEKRLVALIKRIDKIKTLDDYAEFYMDWREWGQEFGELLHVKVLGKTWSGDTLATTNQDLGDAWYDKTMNLLDELEWLFNPHIIEQKKAEPKSQSVEAWLKDAQRVKTEASQFAKRYFTELKKIFKKGTSLPDHYVTQEENISGILFMSIVAEHDEAQKTQVEILIKSLEESAKVIRRAGLGNLLKESRAIANFQAKKQEANYACLYDESKDRIIFNQARVGFFWERAILFALGERSWHQFLRTESQQDWTDFVSRGVVTLTSKEYEGIGRFCRPYLGDSKTLQDLYSDISSSQSREPLELKIHALLYNYSLTLSGDNSGSLDDFIVYAKTHIQKKFNLLKGVGYSEKFTSSRGVDPVILAWADTLVRYVLRIKIEPIVESEFVRIAGL